jgi:hypothetical protein
MTVLAVSIFQGVELSTTVQPDLGFSHLEPPAQKAYLQMLLMTLRFVITGCKSLFLSEKGTQGLSNWAPMSPLNSTNFSFCLHDHRVYDSC